MKVSKQAGAMQGGTPTPEQMELVNLQAKAPMEPEQVYVFSVRLCDDQVDRDGERFDTGALEPLGRMFLGKPGIVDHNWSAEKQAARIFHTEVVREGQVSWLKAWAYVPRMGKEQLIADIESGIRREVSISCSMGRRECSLCGGEIGACGHVPGRTYEGGSCVGILKEPRDAYEFSFVAVPAQPQAGVMKAWEGGEEVNLKEFVEKSGLEALKQELMRLKKLAEYGQARRRTLEADVVRMGVALELGLDRQSMKLLAEELEDDTLEKLHEGLSKKLSALHPGESQLAADGVGGGEREAYLI